MPRPDTGCGPSSTIAGVAKRSQPDRKGRFFKAPDADDLRRVETAASILAEVEATGAIELPEEEVPNGDENRSLETLGLPPLAGPLRRASTPWG